MMRGTAGEVHKPTGPFNGRLEVVNGEIITLEIGEPGLVLHIIGDRMPDEAHRERQEKPWLITSSRMRQSSIVKALARLLLIQH
jgi:hypothetical protein